ncbi:MAG: DCC1-like thiol-disulfide oxidoreductase family protein [Lentisphaeraceae bacterium]|nr:DCC1-like thiol-disulfide oxidoreductase family protein [Lentisphaeraceae bacterium]
MSSENAIVIFDGQCNLCSSSVKFIIERDKKAYFKFLPLQSEQAKKLLENKNTEQNLDSVVLVENDEVFIRSRAALKISAKLTWPWRIVSWLRIIPSFLIDPLYKLVAKSRYKIWGKTEECMLPSPELKDRFLD